MLTLLPVVAVASLRPAPAPFMGQPGAGTCPLDPYPYYCIKTQAQAHIARPSPMDSLPDLLSRHAHRIWRGQDQRPAGPQISTGYRALNEAIGGGWPTSTLVEVMTFGGGLGRSSLLLPVLATLTQSGKESPGCRPRKSSLMHRRSAPLAWISPAC